ncbi:hypothetical protein Voc01_003910 [Virgisporangium ochraceum]|uniref:Septum formation initiator n=2 Tax=Virgisporangium ochraceum TaxID=65505 RepID=A0A8J3ZKD4_9ACTN|nr:hypothetical protein Voc01_003910 [Virgisporangium ochraceum]
MSPLAERPDQGQPDLRIVLDEKQPRHTTHGSRPAGRNRWVNGSLGSDGARVNHPGGHHRGMRLLFAVAGWVAAAGAATLIGLAGVQVIGNGITGGTGGDILTAEQAARELAAAEPVPTASAPPASVPSPSTPASDPSTPPPTAGGPVNVQVFGGPGGTVRAGCLPGGAVLVTWSPAQGYSVEEYRVGPGEYAEVRFDRGSSSGKGNGESRVRVRCVGGVPAASWD